MMKETTLKLGAKIRNLRRREKLSQVQLAEKLDISPSYLNLIEHNRRPLSAPLLIKLAQIAVAENCYGMRWQVLEWNEPALKFYDTLGAHVMDEWETMRLMEPALSRLANADGSYRP